MRSSALDIVWWGLGKTDGISEALRLLSTDPDEDVRMDAALALYEAARDTQKEAIVRAAFEKIAHDSNENEDVRKCVLERLNKLGKAGPA